jgi:hypothetical protein
VARAKPVRETPLEQALRAVSLGRRAEPFCQRPPRLPLDHPVRFRAVGAPRSAVGALRNISEGGAYISASQIPDPGSLLAFGFYLERDGAELLLRSMGQVVWISAPGSAEHPGFGLRFVEPPAAMLETIGALIDEQQPRWL